MRTNEKGLKEIVESVRGEVTLEDRRCDGEGLKMSHSTREKHLGEVRGIGLACLILKTAGLDDLDVSSRHECGSHQ